MKKFLVPLLFFPCILLAQWQPVVMPGSSGSHNVVFLNGVFLVVTEDGIFRSTNNGELWQMAWPTADINAYLWTDGAMVYAAHEQNGLVKSSDNGQTWEPLANSLPVPAKALAANNDFVFVAGGNALYRYAKNEGPTQIPVQVYSPPFNLTNRLSIRNEEVWISDMPGIYKSLDNGGTWLPVDTASTATSPFDVHGDVVMSSFNGLVLRSLDAGQTWSQFDPGFYAAGIFRWQGGFWFCNSNSELRVSADDGNTWELIGPGDIGPGNGKAARNGDVVIWSQVNGCYRSSNFGQSWEYASGGMRYNGSEEQSLEFIGNYLSVVPGPYFSPNGGQYWYSNIGVEPNFAKIFQHNGLFYALHNSTESKLFVSPNGDFHEWLPTAFQYPVFGGIDDIFSIGNALVIIDNDQIYRSFDLGASWQQTGAVPPNTSSATYLHEGSLFKWSDTPFALLASIDLGATWSTVGNGLPTTAFGALAKELVSTDGFLYIKSGGEIYISTDDGQSFSKVDVASITSPNTTNHFWRSAMKGNHVYLNNETAIFHSSDFGQSWENIYGNLPDSSLLDVNLFTGPDALYVLFKFDQIPIPNCWKLKYTNLQFQSIFGQVYADDNNNGQPDNGETTIENILIKAGQNSYALSQSDGTFASQVYFQTDSIKAFPPIAWAEVNPPFYLASQASSNLSFGIYYPPGIIDAQVILTEANVFRPGFNTTLYVTTKNEGTAPISGQVKLVLGANLSFISANVAPSAIIGDTLVWDVQNIGIGFLNQLVVAVKTAVSTPIGTLINCVASIETAQPDADPSNNTIELIATVVGSYDPNDKLASPMPYTTLHLAEREPITYTVRFQNTGNFPADFVRIIDTLDQQLDVGSFTMLAASHPYTYSVSGNGIFNFFFDNIHLPPAATDEPGSQGFVKFSVRPRAGLSVGDQIPNRAGIYFDFNPPIITNMVVSTIELPHMVLSTTVNETACEGEVVAGIEIHSDTVFAVLYPGTTTDTFVTYQVFLLPSSTSEISAGICQGESLIFDGQTLTMAGVYVQVLENQFGCDSIVTLTLSVSQNDATSTTIELCQGEASPLTGTVYPIEGEFQEQAVLQNQSNCDSVVTATVVVHPNEFGEGWANVPYGYIAADGTVVTEPYWEVTHDTTEFGCEYLIAILLIPGPNATDDISNTVGWKVFPNPASKFINMEFELPSAMPVTIYAFDAFGKKIAVPTDGAFFAKGLHRIKLDIADWPPGLYLLMLASNGGAAIRRIVK